MMRVLDIIEGTVVDGVGLRTSIYFAGCTHHCPECHNPQSWDLSGGTEMSVDDIMERIAQYGLDVTFSGGDPLMQIDNGLLDLAARIHTLGLNIWCYTGYTLEEIKSDSKLRPILDAVDVLVEGRYIAALRDIHLPFRGSSNQRIIDTATLREIDQPIS
ncbi:MAG: anaerobic ribonucleoside-triphosphate reductase activating protein [Muribaculaceae bacterium]|nr:anaerobic ribonucleoside-triphosphate reductase activating protein [Muribaculaceae bacterium]MDE6504100.1 anaerobic ribonucleoside-triphosphate reductase activating protein [Muribaculaceae bacterium]